jgi:DNA-binding HxlR family transcriptional regulator
MFAGITRFSQFQKSLGVATNILAKRLDDFVAAGAP